MSVDRTEWQLSCTLPFPRLAAARAPDNTLALRRGTARAPWAQLSRGAGTEPWGGKSYSSLGFAGSSCDGPATGRGRRGAASMWSAHMKLSSLYFATPLCCLCLWQAAPGRDIGVPAGTLMTCTLDEPKFSSATVNVGDPFLCYPRNMQQFGQVVFPRGTYMVGHLEADKEPGHFVGKGYLKLAFDRIGLPATDIPVTAKVVAVAGFNVDREGKIIGHGHATRDVVEWMLPPLWPWKVLTLPARGPRPTLKGETRVTLRVMEDFVVPLSTSRGWHRFGEENSSLMGPRVTSPTQSVVPAGCHSTGAVPRRLDPSAPRVQEVSAVMTTASPATSQASSSQLQSEMSASAWPADVTLFALRDGTVFPANQYWRDQDQLTYVAEGDKATVALTSIDWSATARLNTSRNIRVTLRNAPAAN